MKHFLIFILLGFSASSFGQIKSFDDIKNINSVDQFYRVCIENGYQESEKSTDYEITYANQLRETEMETTAHYWGGYYVTDYKFLQIKSDEWYFLEADVSWGRQNSVSYYDKIMSEVKKQCSFYKIMVHESKKVVTYSCPNSTYKGKIGFYEADGNGIIIHLIPD